MHFLALALVVAAFWQAEGSISDVRQILKNKNVDLVKLTDSVFELGSQSLCSGMKDGTGIRGVESVKFGLCDMTVIKAMSNILINPATSKDFLDKFFEFKDGKRLSAEMKKIGISEATLRSALMETWFSETKTAEFPKHSSAFERVFLGLSTASKNPVANGPFDYYGYVIRNSLLNSSTHDYSSKIYSDLNTAIFSMQANYKPTGEDKVKSTRFLFGVHPFQNLVMYSLCFWKELPVCTVTLPTDGTVAINMKFTGKLLDYGYPEVIQKAITNNF